MAAMATHATITFSQPGVQPPVYVTSSLSGWTPLEMDVAPDTTAAGDLVFTKHFTNVQPGSYQYKVRLGDDHWILDESKETGMPACLPACFLALFADTLQLPTTKAFATTSSMSSLPAMKRPKAQPQMLPLHRHPRQATHPLRLPRSRPRSGSTIAKTAQWIKISSPPPQLTQGPTSEKQSSIRPSGLTG